MTDNLHQKEIKKQEAIKRAIKEAQNVRRQFTKKTLDLATSAFGLVAALAWNEVIKEAVNSYIRPFFGKESGFISLVIYAITITFLAVLVTYNLSKIAEKEKKN